MHITFQKTELLNAVTITNNVVDKKNTIPILSNILLSLNTETQTATLTGTNLEIGMSTTIPVMIHDAGIGSITIPSEKLFNILKELPDNPVDISVDEKMWITITCHNATFKLAGLTEGDFPAVGQEQLTGISLMIPSATLIPAITKTLYSTSNDESRYALIGVLWDFDNIGKTLTLATTDGHRLNAVTLHFPDTDIPHQSFIVPKKAMGELKKLDEEAVKVTFDNNTVMVVAGNTTLYSRLIDVQYPDYRQVIPTGDPAHHITVNLVDLQRALRRVSLLTSETFLVKLFCDGNGIQLSAHDPNFGESEERIDCQHTGNGDIAIGVNAKYLLEMLTSVSVDEIQIMIRDPLSPIQIVAEDNLINVIMPMRV